MDINIKLSDKQKEALEYLNNDYTTEVLFGGGAGSGKTFLGCAWVIINCIKYPGTKWLIGRSRLKSLKESTLATFFDIAKQWNLNDKHYNYNQQSNQITFYNGSIIILKDLFLYPSDPNFDTLGSLEITGAFLDESNQISLKAKNIVMSRARYKLDVYNLIPKMLMTCNPARNWVYEDFYKKDKDGTLEEYKHFIQSLVSDNIHISKHYIDNLNKLPKVDRDRLLLGKWEYEDKGAIIEFDKMINIFKDYNYREDDINPNDYYISVDVARKGKDKAVIILWHKFNILKIKTLDISKINEIVDIIKDLKNKYKINSNHIVIDADGVGGGVVDYLPNSIEFINNSRALNEENYYNLKTQCYFKLADKINDESICIFNYIEEEKEFIIQELMQVKRKDVDKDGKLKLITKDEIKQLIGRSPDYSDAMMLRMYFEIENTGELVDFFSFNY